MDANQDDTRVGCSKHNSVTHDFFISYRVDQSTQSKLAADLQKSLENAGDRFFQNGLKVYLDKLCIKDAAHWEDEFLSGLKGSTAVIFLLTQRSWNIMVNHLKQGIPDNVLKEIKLALELEKRILPVRVKEEHESDFFSFDKQELKILENEDFAELKHVVKQIQNHQMLDIEATNFQRSLFNILNAVFPAEVSELSLARVPAPSNLSCINGEHMREIATALASTGYCVVSGIGGVGKSTTVQQFIQFVMGIKSSASADSIGLCMSPCYETVFWIDCASFHTAMDCFREIFKSTSDDETLAALSALLMKKGRFLMVLDNVDDIAVLESIFGELALDQQISGDFIVTTRLEEIPDGSFLSLLMDRSEERSQRILDVSFWDMKKTRAYVLQRCPDLRTTSAAVLDSLLEAVGGFPIVIDQLIAYYDHCKPSIPELEAALKVIMMEGDETKGSTASLTHLVKLGLQRLEQSEVGMVAISAYGCMGLVNGSKMQFKLLEAFIEQMCNKRGLDAADIDALEVLSLLKTSGILRQTSGDGIFAIHKLHQEIIRSADARVTSCDLSGIFSATCSAIFGIMATKGSFSKEQCAMASHVQYVSKFGSNQWWTQEVYAMKNLEAQVDVFFSRFQSCYEKLKDAIPRGEKIFGSMENSNILVSLQLLAAAASSLGYFEEADKTYQNVLNLRIKEDGTRESEFVASILNGIGLNLQSQGKSDEALKSYQEAVNIYSSVFGTKIHPDVASALSNMGLAAQSLSKFELAIKYYQESLDVNEELFGTREHIMVATTLNNLGFTSFSQGKYQEAIAYYQEAIATFTSVYGTSVHINIANTLNNTGLALNSIGKYNEAMLRFQESLDTYDQVFGSRNHTVVAVVLNNMGICANGLSQFEKALNHHKEAYSILLKLFPTKAHPEVASTLSNIAALEERQGKFEEALAHCQETLEICEKVFGTRKGEVAAAALNCIGSIESSQSRFEQALAAYQESVDIKIELYGTILHASIATTLNNMALISLKLGSYDKAIKFLKECINIQAEVYGTRKHAEVGTMLNNLGYAHWCLEQNEEAGDCYVEALDIYNEVFESRDHEEVAALLNNMGNLARSQEDYDMSLELLQDSLDMYIKVFGSKYNGSAATALSSMGSTAQEQGEYEEALKYYEEALSIYEKVYGTRVQIDVASTLNNMGAAASNNEDYDRAMQCFRESMEIKVKINGTRENEDVAITLLNMAGVEYAREDYAQAVAYSTEGLEIIKKISPDSTMIESFEEFIGKIKEKQEAI